MMSKAVSQLAGYGRASIYMVALIRSDNTPLVAEVKKQSLVKNTVLGGSITEFKQSDTGVAIHKSKIHQSRQILSISLQLSENI